MFALAQDIMFGLGFFPKIIILKYIYVGVNEKGPYYEIYSNSYIYKFK